MYIWKTGHHINDVVSDALHAGIPHSIIKHASFANNYAQSPLKKVAVGYGILRGTADVFAINEAAGVDYYEVDRGYIRPGHFDGYYRISKNGLQARYHEHKYPTDRLDNLNVKTDNLFNEKGHILICPPTLPIQQYYGVANWQQKMEDVLKASSRRIRIRDKGDTVPLEHDLDGCYAVVTFNSNVAVDAIIKGIPAVTSPFSIVHRWSGYCLQDVVNDKITRINEANRIKFLSFVSYNQFTLKEIQDGVMWRILNE